MKQEDTQKKKEELNFVTEYLARTFKLLGDQNRLKIVFTLQSGQKSVSEIMQDTDLPQTLVSFHLKTLREANVLKAERKATFIYYSLVDPRIIEYILSFMLLENLKFDVEDEIPMSFKGICNPQEMMEMMKGVFRR